MPDLDGLLHDAARETCAAFAHPADVSMIHSTSRRRTTTRYLASGLTAAAVITGAVALTSRDPGEQQARGSTSSAPVIDPKTSYKPIDDDHLAEVLAENRKLLAEAGPDQQARLTDGYVSPDELELAAQAKLLCLAAGGIADATYTWDADQTGISFSWAVPNGQDPQTVGDQCDRRNFDAVSSAYAIQVDLLNDPTAGVEQALDQCRSTDLGSYPTAEALTARCWNQIMQELLDTSKTSGTPTSIDPGSTDDDQSLYTLPDPTSGS